MMLQRRARVVAIACAAVIAAGQSAGAQNLAIALFDRYLEPLRVQAGIPGLSAAIVQDGTVVWERGFGHADVDSATAARPDTPYHVADLTQTFTAILLAQCAEDARLGPDDPIRRWVPATVDPPATLRQVLTHTAGPTGLFQYDPARFAALTGVVDWCSALPYRKALANLLDSAAMVDAIPGAGLPAPPATDEPTDPEPLFDRVTLIRYQALMLRLATPYRVDRRGRATASEHRPTTINAATGLLASVRDLAKYDRALDYANFVRTDTMAQIWTSQVVNGATMPTTMGWFSQTYEGQRLIWHFGVVPDGYSSLILKVPGRRLTLILLANSDGLSAPFALHDGDVTSSLFARTFLRLFL